MSTLKSGRYFSEYLIILNDLNVDTSHWVESTIPNTDEFLDAVDFEEPIIVTEIVIKEDGLAFLNTSSNDTFDPVVTFITLNKNQIDEFMIKNQSLYSFCKT